MELNELEAVNFLLEGKTKYNSVKQCHLEAFRKIINLMSTRLDWSENNVVTDEDFEKEDSGAVEAAGALGDLAGICEILMFDRGEGTYSLKFIKNC